MKIEPKIKVIGIGSSGIKIINYALNHEKFEHIKSIDFIVMDTDSESLSRSLAEYKIHLKTNKPKDLKINTDATFGKSLSYLHKKK